MKLQLLFFFTHLLTLSTSRRLGEDDETEEAQVAEPLQQPGFPDNGSFGAPPPRPPDSDITTLYNADTFLCVGDGDGDGWLDVRTSCQTGGWGYGPLQLAYTQNLHLVDANTGMCLDNMNRFYSNQKAYPKLQRCRNTPSQEFHFVRIPGATNYVYRILTFVNNRPVFAGYDQDRDLVFEPLNTNCWLGNCQAFGSFQGTLSISFFSNAQPSFP